MCYSLAASIIAFSIDIVAAIILYFNVFKIHTIKRRMEDDKVFAYVVLGASTMQLAEWIIHTDPECTGVNQSGSRLAYFSLLFLEPIFSYFGIAYHGVERMVYGWNIIPVIWTICLCIYAIVVAYITEDEIYLSTTLQRNVSNWCTVDYVCDRPECSLEWKWDPMNDSWSSYILFFLLALGLPMFSLDAWELWLLLFILFFTLQQVTQWDFIKGSASCFWIPILVIIIQLSTLPHRFHEWIMKMYMRCRGYSPP